MEAPSLNSLHPSRTPRGVPPLGRRRCVAGAAAIAVVALLEAAVPAADAPAAAPGGPPPAPRGGPPPTPAVEAPDRGQDDRSVLQAEMLRDRALSAVARGDFESGRAFLARWLSIAPGTREASVLHARCLLELGHLAEAQEAYAALIDARPEEVEARIGEARISMRRAERETHPDLRAAHERAAREAISVAIRENLTALRATRSYPELAPLRADARLMIDLIRAPRPIGEPEGLDPFRVRIARVDEVTPPVGASDVSEDVDPIRREIELRALAEKIPALLEELDRAAERPEQGGVGRALERLDEVVRRIGALCGKDHARRDRLLRPLEARRPLLRAARLRLMCDEGEAILAEVRSAASGGRHATAAEAGLRLEEHARAMVGADPLFADAAADLLEAGRPLIERARALVEAERLPIVVSGTILGDGRAIGIVNGRPVSAGDSVADARGLPIPDLFVREVERRRVRLSLRGHDFEARVR